MSVSRKPLTTTVRYSSNLSTADVGKGIEIFIDVGDENKIKARKQTDKTKPILFVLEDYFSDDGVALVSYNGITKATSGGAVDIGDRVTVSAASKFILAATGEHFLGFAANKTTGADETLLIIVARGIAP